MTKPVIPIPENVEVLDYITDSEITALTVMQAIICVAGAIGNSITLLSIILCKKLWTTPNVYIAHLALVDMFVCAFVIPIGMASNFSRTIPPGCAVLGAINISCMAGSLYTMFLISLNRYILVCKGKKTYRKWYTKRNVSLSIFFLWVYDLILLTPILSGAGTLGYNEKYKQCFFKAYDFDSWLFTVASLCSFAFCPPATFTTFAYIKIIKHLKKTGRQEQAHDMNNVNAFAQDGYKTDTDMTVFVTENQHTQSHSRSVTNDSVTENGLATDTTAVDTKADLEVPKKVHREEGAKDPRAIIGLLAVFIVFLIFWSPLNFIFIMDYYGSLPAVSYTFEVTFAYMNSAINIILYVLLNKTHRAAYKLLLTCRFRELRNME